MRRLPSALTAVIPALVATTIAVTACHDSTAPYGDLMRATAKAKDLWVEEGLTSYAFVASRSCECLREATGPVRIVVENSHLVSATMVATGAAVDTALWFDINALFTLIESELNAQPSLLEVSFDPSWGYPTRVKYGAIEIDAGAVILVTEFTPAPNPG